MTWLAGLLLALAGYLLGRWRERRRCLDVVYAEHQRLCGLRPDPLSPLGLRVDGAATTVARVGDILVLGSSRLPAVGGDDD